MSIERAISYFGSQTNMAIVIDVTQQTISDWVRGKLKPSVKNSVKIERATNGKVTRQQLRPDIFGEI